MGVERSRRSSWNRWSALIVTITSGSASASRWRCCTSASALPAAIAASPSRRWKGGRMRRPPWVRSRSHGRPLARWSLRRAARTAREPTRHRAAVGHVGQGDVDQPVHPGERQRRLGPPLRQRPEAPTAAARQHHHQHATASSTHHRRWLPTTAGTQTSCLGRTGQATCTCGKIKIAAVLDELRSTEL